MPSIRARRTRGGTSRDAIRASMRGDDVVVDFDSNDVPYYALAGALADALPSSPIAAFARDDDVGDSFNSSTVSARATTRVDARWCRRG